jgi:hypothetical protein
MHKEKTLSLNLEGKKEVVAEVSARLAKAQTVVWRSTAACRSSRSPSCARRRALPASTFEC